MLMKCECHERDSSYACDYCHEQGIFGHVESHLEIDYLKDKLEILEDLVRDAKYIIDDADDTDVFFEFVLGVAGLDGDPEYQ